MTTNEDLHELTVAYALDALDADERTAYEAHLAGCERCRSELAELGGTVGALAVGAGSAEPPPALRDRILAAAREEGPSNVVALRPSRRPFYVAGVAAVAAAAALAIWAGLSGPSENRLSLSVAVQGGAAQATVTGLPAAPAGKAYELWVIEGKVPQPAGLFPGGGSQVVTLTRPAPSGSTVAVTLERASGSDQPTTRVLVATQV